MSESALPGRRASLVTVLALAVSMIVAPASPASAAVTISGTITCLNSSSPVGVWVDATKSTDGWAKITVPIVGGGHSKVTYSFTLNNGGSYKLNVGCGGNSKKWGMSLSTAVVTGSGINFRCNNIHPALSFLAKRIARVDLTQGIPYGVCGRV